MEINHLEDMTTSRMEHFSCVSNNKFQQAYSCDRNKDSVNTSAISNILSQSLQRLIKESNVRQGKIELFKNFVADDCDFSDETVDKILANLVRS